MYPCPRQLHHTASHLIRMPVAVREESRIRQILAVDVRCPRVKCLEVYKPPHTRIEKEYHLHGTRSGKEVIEGASSSCTGSLALRPTIRITGYGIAGHGKTV